MTIDAGLRLPPGCARDASDAVRLRFVSVLNVAPAGVRVTVRVNWLPAATSTAGTPRPPRVELSVEAAAEMPVGAGAAVAPAGIVAAIAAPMSTAQASAIRNKWIRTITANLGMTTPSPPKPSACDLSRGAAVLSREDGICAGLSAILPFAGR